MTLRTPAFNDAKTYGFEWLRLSNELPLQEGVLGAGDFKVTAAAGGGMRVDLASGVATVKGDSGVAGTGLSQGLYMAVNDATVLNAATLAAADATNPRIDQVCLQVRDSADLGSGGDDLQIVVLTGAATAGATLDNRTGAALLGNDKVRLADIIVPAGTAAVTAGNVRDRRPWARGLRTQLAATGTTANSTTTMTPITGLTGRCEFSGAAPVLVTFAGGFQGAVANIGANAQVLVDGVVGSFFDTGIVSAPTAGLTYGVAGTHLTTALSGSRVMSGAFASAVGGSSVTMQGPGLFVPRVAITELVGQFANNT